VLRSLTCEGAAFPEKLEARLGHDRGRGAAVARRVIKGRGVRLRRSLDFLLAIIAIVSVTMVFLSHEDPFVRIAVCTYIGPCPTVAHAKAWYKVFYDLGIGALVSLAFYLLVVRLPDYQRRQRLKRSLSAHYKAFRKGCIQTMLGVVHGKIDTRTAEALIEPHKFRQYFQEPVGPRKSRWHEFFNNLNETSLRELQTSMEIFREELIFILNNTDIQKDEAFEFIKRLSASIYSLNSAMARHDEVAPLSDFLEATAIWLPMERVCRVGLDRRLP